MRSSQAEAATAIERMGRLAEPLTDMGHKLTDAIGDTQDRLVEARDSAGDAIADHPLRWTLAAFVAGLIVGAILGNQRTQ